MKILIADDDDVTRLLLEDNQAENVEHIITSGQHLPQLVDRILSVSKFQADDLNFLASADERLPLPQRERLAR